MPKRRSLKPRKSKAPAPLAESTDLLLALDTSSSGVGWALFDCGQLVDWGVKYPGVLAGPDQRLSDFQAWLAALFERWKPTAVVVEQPFQGRRRWSFAVLIQYIALVHLTYYRHFGREMPPGSSIQARTVKKLHVMPAKQTHTTNKQNAVALVNRLYGLGLVWHSNKIKSQDDTADAILLGRTWHMQRRLELHP